MLVSIFVLMTCEHESGCLGLENQAFGIRDIAKKNFRRSRISNESRIHFSCFWVALGFIFMTFDGLETGSKFDDFSR